MIKMPTVPILKLRVRLHHQSTNKHDALVFSTLTPQPLFICFPAEQPQHKSLCSTAPQNSSDLHRWSVRQSDTPAEAFRLGCMSGTEPPFMLACWHSESVCHSEEVKLEVHQQTKNQGCVEN